MEEINSPLRCIVAARCVKLIIVPDLNRVAVLRDVADQMAAGLEWTALDEAARQLGLTLVAVDAKSADELETAFADMKKSGAEALFVTRTALFSNGASRSPISRSRPICRRAAPSGPTLSPEDW